MVHWSTSIHLLLIELCRGSLICVHRDTIIGDDESTCGRIATFAAVLVAELALVLSRVRGGELGAAAIAPKDVAVALFGSYVLGVELASMLLLAGLVGAYHLGRRESAAATEGEAS